MWIVWYFTENILNEQVKTNFRMNVRFFQPYIPPPDYKLPPEKRGYLRHVPPSPKQVRPENFHVESVHLRHSTSQRHNNRTPSEQPRYSHLLRKTGRRGELGIEEDDDSEVTRISFNVSLVGVSWKRIHWVTFKQPFALWAPTVTSM